MKLILDVRLSPHYPSLHLEKLLCAVVAVAIAGAVVDVTVGYISLLLSMLLLGIYPTYY